MAKLLLGKEVTAAMNEKLQARVAALKEKGVSPKLAIVRCGENPSDLSYEKGATARAEVRAAQIAAVAVVGFDTAVIIHGIQHLADGTEKQFVGHFAFRIGIAVEDGGRDANNHFAFSFLIQYECRR